MNTKLKFESLFVYSENRKKFFYTGFSDGVNIIHGRNTSGKSTLFQSIIFAMGINDGRTYLTDVLEEEVIFRLDCLLEKNGKTGKVIFVRDGDTLYIKTGKCPVDRFNGISSDNSGEHIKLKEYINDLFEFSLNLQSKEDYKSAPIEAMWLPYYISQMGGWIYLRKSFSSLDFFRNFKEDYLDYYLGIDQFINRKEKQRLQSLLKVKQEEILFIEKYEKGNEDFQSSQLSDEQFMLVSNEYLDGYIKRADSLKEMENKYVLKCNDLKYLEQRLSVLNKVSKNHKKQSPVNGNCPTCAQRLPFNIPQSYEYFQDENDTDKELSKIKEKIKVAQAEVNSLANKIPDHRSLIAKNYVVLNRHFKNEVTYESWLKSKATVQLLKNLNKKLGELYIQKKAIEDELDNFKTDEQVQASRIDKENVFSVSFLDFLKQLGIINLKENRHTKLYQISAFPSQGVALHKTVMAYHFAFNRLIKNTGYIHRLPFMLDAIFNEDIDDGNKSLILTFISKNRPNDTQLLFSIAHSENELSKAENYNRDYFNGQGKLICIGEGIYEEAFLTQYNNQESELLQETMEIINDTAN